MVLMIHRNLMPQLSRFLLMMKKLAIRAARLGLCAAGGRGLVTEASLACPKSQGTSVGIVLPGQLGEGLVSQHGAGNKYLVSSAGTW